jgi:hypothetical protein
MTTAHDIDWPQVLAERLTTTHPDVLRELLATFIQILPSGESRGAPRASNGSLPPNLPAHRTSRYRLKPGYA